MTNFLDNTIYTNYALNKICKNLVDNYENFNFIKVKVGSGDNTLYQDRVDISESVYTLIVQSIEYKDGRVTIRCEFPTELGNIAITEIGLYDTFLGVDHLFSYSKVDFVKPIDINYELNIVINLGPRIIDFPGINEFIINEPEYATRTDFNELSNALVFIDTNLERVIASNADKIGYNMAEVAYQRQRMINEWLRNNTYASLYYSLNNKYKDKISDLYFLHEPDFLSYMTTNFVQYDSYLNTSLKLFESHYDHVTFHGHENNVITTSSAITLGAISENCTESSSWTYKTSDDKWHKNNSSEVLNITSFKEDIVTYTGTPENNTLITVNINGFTLLWVAKLDDISVASTIMNKKTENSLYFSIDTKQNEEVYQILSAEGQEPIEHKATYNELVITLYGLTSEYKIKYIFDDTEKGKYIGQQLSYALTFNGSFSSPKFQLYINGKAIEKYNAPSASEGRQIQEKRSASDLYNTAIYGDSSALINMPDASSCQLKNYDFDYTTGQKYNYQNALNILSIMTLKKQANKNDIAFLGSVFRMLAEVDY